MDQLPDLAHLTLLQLLSTLLFFAAIDTIVAYAVALMNGNFEAGYALDFLRTHVLKVGVPVALLAIVGTGVPAAGVPAIPIAFGAAVATLGVYIITTIASIKDSFADKAIAPTSTSSVAPVVGTADTPTPGSGAV